jgi:hypothetical protein
MIWACSTRSSGARRTALGAFRKFLAASSSDDAGARKDAEERIKTLEAAVNKK